MKMRQPGVSVDSRIASGLYVTEDGRSVYTTFLSARLIGDPDASVYLTRDLAHVLDNCPPMVHVNDAVEGNNNSYK
jgi:hypothetical protein